MSAAALGVTWRVVPVLPVLLEVVDAKRRPATERAALVAVRLADAYRDRRGWVDETVAQVEAAVGFDPRTALQALDVCGVWTVDRRGRRGVGSRRTPGPVLAAISAGSDPAQIAASISAGSDPFQMSAHLGGVNGSSRRGNPLISAGLTPLHPLTYPVTNRAHGPRNVHAENVAGTSAAARALEQRTARRLAGTACPRCADTGMVLEGGHAYPCPEDHP